VVAVTVREASAADLDGLVAIEWSGDRMFAEIGIRFPPGPADRWGPQLRAEWQAEIDAGLHELGPRLVMVHPGPAAG